MTAPTYNHVLHLRLDAALDRDLRLYASRNNLTLSQAARAALDHGLFRLAVLGSQLSLHECRMGEPRPTTVATKGGRDGA